jgi:hypothetical protein
MGVFALSGALAQTPMSKGNSPGWYRMHLGSFEITVDGDNRGVRSNDKHDGR